MSSGFVSEAEIEERKKHRQEEWEKVRQPHEPEKAPEEPYDPRTLYERLEEQRKKKEYEFEETHKLKNMIKGLDDDEVGFLEMVDRKKMAEDKQKREEEEAELKRFRNKVAATEAEFEAKRVDQEVASVANILLKKTAAQTSKPAKKNRLEGVVVKKRAADADVVVDNGVAKKAKVEDDKKDEKEEEEEEKGKYSDDDDSSFDSSDAAICIPSAMRVAGIYPSIPGLASYTDSSTDSDSSNSDDDKCPRHGGDYDPRSKGAIAISKKNKAVTAARTHV